MWTNPARDDQRLAGPALSYREYFSYSPPCRYPRPVLVWWSPPVVYSSQSPSGYTALSSAQSARTPKEKLLDLLRGCALLVYFQPLTKSGTSYPSAGNCTTSFLFVYTSSGYGSSEPGFPPFHHTRLKNGHGGGKYPNYRIMDDINSRMSHKHAAPPSLALPLDIPHGFRVTLNNPKSDYLTLVSE